MGPHTLAGPWKSGASNSVATLLIPNLLRGIQRLLTRRGAKTGDRVFSDLQKPLLNLHLAVVRIVMT